MEKENELSSIIPIKENGGKQVVSARCLYAFLEATERFQSWFERQLQYGFIEECRKTNRSLACWM